MRILLSSLILAVTLSFIFSELSFATCSEGPVNTFTCVEMPTPDPTGIQEFGNNNNLIVNVEENAAIDTVVANGGNGGPGISTGPGSDTITVTNASVSGEDDAIDTGSGGADVLTITGSEIFGRFDGIDADGTTMQITIHNSSVTTPGSDAITTSGATTSLIINITDSILLGTGSNAIESNGGGTDVIMIENSTLTGGQTALALGSSDATITFKTGAEIVGDIRCGPGDDTLIFAMQVRTRDIAELTEEIDQLDPNAGSITINGLSYFWEDCEELVADLEPGLVSPVPTLNQWGLIAMAAALGIVGFMIIRKRQAAV